MAKIKIVVTGAVNSGKSRFIKTISDIDVIDTDQRTSDELKLIKKQTTVAMDFGKVHLNGRTLYLFGTPGQRRFDFMWDILAGGVKGIVVLVDSTAPQSFPETQNIIRYFKDYGHIPYLVAASKQDLPRAMAPAPLRAVLGISPAIQVVPCIATQKDSIMSVLHTLVEGILAHKTH